MSKQEPSSQAVSTSHAPPGKASPAGLFLLLKPYTGLILGLVVLTIAANSLNLVVPKLIARAIDSYTQQNFVLQTTIIEFFAIALFIFILSYLQSVVQTYASERVARDLRTRLVGKIA